MIAEEEDLELGEQQQNYLRTAHAPINLAYGSVASGKNFTEAARLAVYLALEPWGYEKSPFIFGGASTKAIKRIVLNDLFELIGPENYSYKENDGSGRIFNRDFYSFGAAKANSHEPMRGINAGGGMVTELTLAHKNFWDELQMRVRLPGAMIFADTNPGAPNHYVKTDLIDSLDLAKPLSEKVQRLYPNARSMLHVYHFLMKDNPFIMRNPGYMDKLLAMYPPGTVLFKRMIEGLFVMAQGRVYDAYDDHCLIDENDLPTEYDQVLVGIDYGTQNSCVFLLIGVKDNVYYIIREYFYSGRLIGVQQTNSQYLQDFKRFIQGNPSGSPCQAFSAYPNAVFADPSAASFILELSRDGFPMEKADNSVLPGLQHLNSMYASGYIRVCRQGCPQFDAETRAYGWDPVALLRGEEKPLKSGDHGQDAGRYAIFTHQSLPQTQDVYNEMDRLLKAGYYAA